MENKRSVDSARVQLHSLFVAIAVGLHGLAGDLARELQVSIPCLLRRSFRASEAPLADSRDKDSRFAYLQR